MGYFAISASYPLRGPLKRPQWYFALTLSDAGGGRKMPPLSYFCDSKKKINGKSCQFFLTFPKYVNGRLGTTFCSQITFRVVGRGLKWSKLPQFHKGGPCWEQQEAKMTDQNRRLVIHVARNFLVVFLLKLLSLGEI